MGKNYHINYNCHITVPLEDWGLVFLVDNETHFEYCTYIHIPPTLQHQMVDFCHLETNGITSWPMEVPGPIRLFPVGDHRTDDVTIIASTPCSCYKGTNQQNKGNMRSTPHALKWGMSQLQLFAKSTVATFSSTILNYWTTWNLHWEWSPIYASLWHIICKAVRIYIKTIHLLITVYTLHQIIFIVLLFLEWNITLNIETSCHWSRWNKHFKSSCVGKRHDRAP